MSRQPLGEGDGRLAGVGLCRGALIVRAGIDVADQGLDQGPAREAEGFALGSRPGATAVIKLPRLATVRIERR